MVSTKQVLTTSLCLSLLIACAPKKIEADTHVWTVTAQNGDVMVGCFSEDVSSEIVGYINLSTLPNFDINTFKSFEMKHRRRQSTDNPNRHLWPADESAYHPLGHMTMAEYYERDVPHCSSYPAPDDTREWYLSMMTGFSIEYRFFSKNEKMVFVDARVKGTRPDSE